MRTLVLGGIRSGKSRWAEEAIAKSLAAGETVRYVASGPDGEGDAAWTQRLAHHRARRPAHWSTVETYDVAMQLRRPPYTPTLVDDLGNWLTATLDRHQAWESGAVGLVRAAVDDMLEAVSAFPATLVLVSPEVGLSVVPITEAGQRFADELGSLNQRIAELCDQVVLVVAGQPLSIKPAEG